MEKINRREFLKKAGVGAVAAGAVVACNSPKAANKINGGTIDVDGPEQMPYREFGGDKVSVLGYGCMRWQMKKDENGNDIVDQDSVNELVDYAMAHGINYFDSAPVYLQGQSEEATAKALSRYPRESYYVATKLSNHRGGLQTYEAGVNMYKQSLKYYNTDYIDYYLLHNIANYAAFKTRFLDNGILDFLLEQKAQGHIRKLGFSFHGDRKGFDELLEQLDKYKFDFVQIQMNYVDWTHAEANGARGTTNADYMYEQLSKRGVPIVIMEPLLGGALASVPQNVTKQMKSREPKMTVASWAFRFCATHPGVMTVLSGMTYKEHLEDNLKSILHFKPLNDEELEFLESAAGIIKSYPLVPCTGCAYCMPCPYGIDIPTIFKHYNKNVNEGTIAESEAQKDFKKLKKAYLTSYDKAVESIRQADHCIGCRKCMEHCPQSIQIPSELQRIDKYVEALKQEKF